MARTKGKWRRAGRSAQVDEAAIERVRRKQAGLAKAARMLSSQEVADALAERRVLDDDEDYTTEEGDAVFDAPEPEHIIKLCALPLGDGGRVAWKGRVRGGGTDVNLSGSWVHENFKT